MSKPSVGKNEFKGTLIDFNKIKVLTDKDDVFYNKECVFYANESPKLFSACSNDNNDSFMNLPPLTEMQCPIELERIQRHQVHDVGLLARREQRPDLYPIFQQISDGILLICQLKLS